MSAKKHTKLQPLQLVWEFIKLQLAGNILFFGTLGGFYIGDKILHTPQFPTLVVASILANILFFIVDRDWVFTSEGVQRSGRALRRFIIFMVFNFFLNIALIELFGWLLRSTPDATITKGLFEVWIAATGWLTPLTGSLVHNWELYIAQFLSGLVFTGWSFVGLRFWVFAPVRHHARTSRHQAITPKVPSTTRRRSRS